MGNARVGSNPAGDGVNTLSISQLQRLFSACHCVRAVKEMDLKEVGLWFDTQRPHFLFIYLFMKHAHGSDVLHVRTDGVLHRF